MKKSELHALITSKSGTLQANEYCTLVRWREDARGNGVDRLQAIFSITHYGDYITEIYSRSISEIVEELCEAKEIALRKAQEKKEV